MSKIIRLKEIPLRVYIRYGLLTIPGTVVLILVLIVVQNWVAIPVWLWVTLILLWIAKESYPVSIYLAGL